MNIFATYYGANGWLLEIDEYTILIDPWLEGILSFSPGEWLLKGTLKNEIKPPKNIDLLLFTQGLPDHCHPATLKKISKDIHVIGSPKACNICKKLKFINVNLIRPGETIRIKNLRIEATYGANVPHKENGYIIFNDKHSIYIEPHGFLDPNLKKRHIDTLITPVINIGVPFVGDFIKGNDILPSLISNFSPNKVFASTTGGDIQFDGFLNKFLKVKGNIEELNICRNDCQIINPIPFKKYKI